MNAAIVCPGPSCLKTFDPDDCGLVVAVNRAGVMFSSDIWCANDYPLILDIGDKVIGNPVLWTIRDTLDSITRHGSKWAAKAGVVNVLACPVPQWHLFTFTTAMVVAAFSGATAIRTYGDDRTDEPDADGYRHESCKRDADRWAHEGRIRDGVVEWLLSRGVTVERVLPMLIEK